MAQINALTDLCSSVLAPYTKNHNTGNKYEIATLLTILRHMGLSDTDLDACAPLFAAIQAAKNDIQDILVQTRTQAVGAGFCLDGHRVLSLRNVTQDDADGKTGDLVLVCADGREFSVSVCEGEPKKRGAEKGRIEKCLTNPTARRLGATDEDIAVFEAKAAAAVQLYKAHFQATYGPDESAWPSRIQTSFATDACAAVAAQMAARFAEQPKDKQTAILQDLLRIDSMTVLPADYLALVNKKTMKPTFFKFQAPVFTTWAPSMKANGIWLEICNDGFCIGKIQVKFNNGVYHKGKTSSIYSSWNATIYLTDVFNMAAALLG